MSDSLCPKFASVKKYFPLRFPLSSTPNLETDQPTKEGPEKSQEKVETLLSILISFSLRDYKARSAGIHKLPQLERAGLRIRKRLICLDCKIL